MTLHEVIKYVLTREESPLSSKVLAFKINEEKLYLRKDKKEVSSSQVSARVNRYPGLFITKNGYIHLMQYQKDLHIKENISKLIGSLHDHLMRFGIESGYILLDLVLDCFISIKRQNRLATFNISEALGNHLKNYSLAKDEALTYGLLSHIEELYSLSLKLDNLYVFVHYLLKLTLDNRPNYWILPDFTEDVLINLPKIESNSILDIYSSTPPIFLVKLVQHFEHKGIHINLLLTNSNIKNIFESVFTLLEYSRFSFQEESFQKADIGICLPPWNVKVKIDNWNNEFSFLKEQENRLKPNAQKIIIAAPNILYNGGRYQAAREYYTNKQNVACILKLPFQSRRVSISNISLVYLNSERDDETYIGDFSNYSKISNDELLRNIHFKKEIDLVSKIITQNEIFNQYYKWEPGFYLKDDIKVNPEYDLLKLSDVLNSFSRGKTIGRNSLYQGGEVKYISTKDLQKDNLFLEISNDTLGVDHDSSIDNHNRIENNTVIVTLAGKDLKPNIFKSNDEVIIDSNLLALSVNNKILSEFLALQLKSESTRKQIDFMRSGVGIPRVNQNYFLHELKIEVPPLEIQKDIIIKENEQSTVEQIDTYNIIGTVKHTLKQPISSITEDFKVLTRYLNEKCEKNILESSDILVKTFEGDNLIQLSQTHSLQSTLKRMDDAIKRTHKRLNSLERLIKIETSQLKLTDIEIKEFLQHEFRRTLNKKIKLLVKGSSNRIKIDTDLFKILVENIAENAEKYAFPKGYENSKVLISISVGQGKLSSKHLLIEYKNNGEIASDEINTSTFLQEKYTSNTVSGDGYGGNLIGKILNRHKGQLELIDSKELLTDEYNFQLNIYLPY